MTRSKRRITKVEARALQERGRFLSAFEIEELRRTPLEVRLRQFFTLLGWAREFGWEEKLSEGVDEVRERWVRLWKAYRGKKKPA